MTCGCAARTFSCTMPTAGSHEGKSWGENLGAGIADSASLRWIRFGCSETLNVFHMTKTELHKYRGIWGIYIYNA